MKTTPPIRMNQLQQRFDDLEERWNHLQSAYSELSTKYCSEHYRLYESEQTNNALTLGTGAIMSENERLKAENAKLKTQLTGDSLGYTSLKDSDDPVVTTFIDKWNRRLAAMTSRPDRRSGGQTGREYADEQQDHVG